MKWAEESRKNMHGKANSIGNLLVEGFHYLGLFAIGAVTAWASVMAFMEMIETRHASVDDILLLFIYLELGAMVGIYFKTNHLPIRFLLYIAITALTRYLIGDVSHHKAPDVGLIYLCGGVFLLSLSVLAVRYASYKFPSSKAIDASGEVIGEQVLDK
ncbi:phosphate-starvation-inducible protein PsiE [Pseudomonas aeruginosa]|uniref:phosphate-starvation-inducible protein PsiE n=1 Tax=Pseudomonas aeruginosa TaxID=287 RepID=UPI0009A764F9|nr:phosphate-starvation-inducible PsiE family protein [Pseudomonas aeruginosa]MCF8576631.1 phosphate-starvation-inducible PsiE family protein [Pseudomonas aeruginosa]MCG7143849.1 phosphate-starvation-inducible PsiE family protein [Pseudomonas aeruginosa]MCG7148700.1 phosphate-starvation-inducible PsiE family protein [Pseudomonas aeruginosa]MCO4040684.1 phosphate-starvation-inducible protein PsiE [Pseudomonas aeruginosa]MDI2414095.1 phosphate-starvation-inducible PsiE family protein [Pseudomona